MNILNFFKKLRIIDNVKELIDTSMKSKILTNDEVQSNHSEDTKPELDKKHCLSTQVSSNTDYVKGVETTNANECIHSSVKTPTNTRNDNETPEICIENMNEDPVPTPAKYVKNDIRPENFKPLEGTYIEDFYKAGKLHISRNSFSIHFYFPGIDGRYKGSTFYIDENEVEDYIISLENSWKRLMELSDVAKSLNGTRLQEDGNKYIKISASGKYHTLYVFVYNLPLSSAYEYKAFLTRLKEVTSRAKYIQEKVFK